MAARIIVGLAVIAAIVQGLWPDLVPENILPLVIVVLGLVYGVMCLDAEDATGYLALAIAVGAAAGADVLGHIHVVGDYLDAIVDQISVALFGGVRGGAGDPDVEPNHAVGRGLTYRYVSQLLPGS